MFSSLRFRLWLTYALVVGVVIIIAALAVVVYLFKNPAEYRQEYLRLRLVSTLLVQRSQIFILPLENSSIERLQEAVKRADTFASARVAIFDANGQILADSRSGIGPALPDWSMLASRQANKIPLYRDSNRRQWLYVVTPMKGGYSLLVTAPLPRVKVLTILRDEFLAPYVRGAILALILSLLLAFWIAHWVTRPLQGIANAARSISSGEYRTIPVDGPEEVKAVARSFNEMVGRVEASQRSQRDFIANVSHDLKTPLTSIQGFAQAILDGTASSPEALKQAAGVIYDEADRMYRMVMDLLELARLDSGVAGLERAPVDMVMLLERITEKFAPQASQARLDLKFIDRVSSGGGSPVIIGDADRLARVFTNLVENALKYTPAQGQVAVVLRPSNGWMEASVADSGQGIPAEDLKRIFERFYQIDKSRRGGNRRGVGLGLAIAREIIQAHGGTITAYNRYQADDPLSDLVQPSETGSVFVVRLPVVRPDDSTLVRRR